MAMTDQVPANKTDRTVRVQKLFITDSNPKGDVRASADSLIRVARLLFKENGHMVDIDLDELFDQYPNWARAAAAFGALTAAANASTSAKDEAGNKGDLDDMITAAEDRVQEFMQGQWSAEAAGPRTNDLVLAYIESRAENGITVPEARIATLRAKLEAGEMTSKSLLADLTVKRSFAKIKARRAAEREAKIMEKTAGAEMSEELDELLSE